MKSYFLFCASIFPFLLLITFFIIYPTLSTRKQVLKLGDRLLVINQNDPFYDWNRMISKHLKFPLDNHYGSHAIVLLAALYASKTGPILELGMGSTSTPLLHALALEQNRVLVSADSDRRWINRFFPLTIDNNLHRLKHVEVNSELGTEWALSGLAHEENWTAVLIDHRPGPRRQFELMLYAGRCDIVILHDTEKSSLYKYDSALTFFPYKYRFKKLKTYTDVLSTRNQTIINTIRSLLESTPDYYFTNITLQ
jgi:hypothetical protein